MFLPGERIQGWGNLVGCPVPGVTQWTTESDLAAAAEKCISLEECNGLINSAYSIIGTIYKETVGEYVDQKDLRRSI